VVVAALTGITFVPEEQVDEIRNGCSLLSVSAIV
jgi:hypothetical protein